MATEFLTYEQMLGELNALLGELVVVYVIVDENGGRQPVAIMGGILRRGAPADLSVVPGELEIPTPFPEGESIIFLVAGEDPRSLASFFITEKTYVGGVREPEGLLTYEIGPARVSVDPVS